MLRYALMVCGLCVVVAAAATSGRFATSPSAPDNAAADSAARQATAPAAAPAAAPTRTIVLTADPRGHFQIDGEVNGTPVAFLVDTGATGIVIGADLARDAGLHLRADQFDRRVSTANGMVRMAQVSVRSLRVGPIELWNVPAQVLDGPLAGSGLLGMEFLKRMESYEVRGDRMVLRW